VKRALLLFLLSSIGFAADQPCVIVKPASTAYRTLVSNKSFQFVEGDYPAGMKWKSNVSDGDVRKIHEKGGKVVILPQHYAVADLEDARKQCAATSEKAAEEKK
jgi:uncharacterized protein YjlB